MLTKHSRVRFGSFHTYPRKVALLPHDVLRISTRLKVQPNPDVTIQKLPGLEIQEIRTEVPTYIRVSLA